MFSPFKMELVKILLLIGILLFVVCLCSKKNIENYRDPIYLNRQKMLCDWYPRANGSIYGEQSHVLSGFPYYDKAY